MGREATCRCRWGERTGNVKVLLEASELIVRGEIRARAPLPALTGVRVDGQDLMFAVGSERVALALGAEDAARWLKDIAKPPPTLAQKLGIAPQTRVTVIGELDDAGLRDALAQAVIVSAAARADVVVLRCDDGKVLERAAARLVARTTVPPVWVVYTKGRTAPLGEAAVREIMRAHGLRDTKVVSVSPALTALRFNEPVRG